jgi:hypothetical protein
MKTSYKKYTHRDTKERYEKAIRMRGMGYALKVIMYELDYKTVSGVNMLLKRGKKSFKTPILTNRLELAINSITVKYWPIEDIREQYTSIGLIRYDDRILKAIENAKEDLRQNFRYILELLEVSEYSFSIVYSPVN